MPKALLIFRRRLGDILCCFPAAKALQRKGYTVFIECDPEYHGIFGLIDYAKPVSTGAIQSGYELVLPLQIHPERTKEYLTSGLTWWEYVYQHPLIQDAQMPIELDHTNFDVTQYYLPQQYSLVIPYGVSARPIYSPAWLMREARQRTKLPVYVLAGPEYAHLPNHICAVELTHLATILKNAETVVTINTSVIYLLNALHSNWYLAPLLKEQEWLKGAHSIIRPETWYDRLDNAHYAFWERKRRALQRLFKTQ